MDYKQIDANLGLLFQNLSMMGIPLDREWLLDMIQGSQKRLVEQKQAINREAGFAVNLHSDDDWSRAALYHTPSLYGKVVAGELVDLKEIKPFLDQLIEARALSSLTRRFQQIYDLANGNLQVLGRSFGLYPKYKLDLNGQITATGELALKDLPEEVLGAIRRQGMMLIKATYFDVVTKVVRGIYGDSCLEECFEVDDIYESCAEHVFKGKLCITPNSSYDVFSLFGRRARIQDLKEPQFVMKFLLESTATDLAKLGFAALFEDYRLGKLGAQIFALAPYSAYLFAPEEHADYMSSVVRECLESAHSDFTLTVSVITGRSLDKLE